MDPPGVREAYVVGAHEFKTCKVLALGSEQGSQVPLQGGRRPDTFRNRKNSEESWEGLKLQSEGHSLHQGYQFLEGWLKTGTHLGSDKDSRSGSTSRGSYHESSILCSPKNAL